MCASASLCHLDSGFSLRIGSGRALTFTIVKGPLDPATPYPVVYVESDGAVRELPEGVRQYLQTPFHPNDGGRPFIKTSLDSLDGWGDASGFFRRTNLPEGTAVRRPEIPSDG